MSDVDVTSLGFGIDVAWFQMSVLCISSTRLACLKIWAL